MQLLKVLNLDVCIFRSIEKPRSEQASHQFKQQREGIFFLRQVSQFCSKMLRFIDRGAWEGKIEVHKIILL